ncbi:MAG: cob(I)yrinic acid a,c-diamide adenosyltransferase [Actinobacteria bacterium]|nr:cob(I)yrinic acid a,c-diamide adenosyltransferase [Actinomycetota bacterium]
MVNLTRIYTRTGDAGRTRLSDMSETAKTDPRVEAYGHVDEANSLLGIVTMQADLPEDVRATLRHIQNELFDCGADLSNPLSANPPWEPLRVIQPYIDRLEAWCDEYGEPLPPLRSFILPGGGTVAAFLHQARTVCLARSVVRRAERAGWRAAEAYGTEPAAEGRPGGVNLLALTYLNRLSDLLFILARVTGQAAGEVLWVPGKDREVAEPRARRQRERISGSETPEEPTPAS